MRQVTKMIEIEYEWLLIDDLDDEEPEKEKIDQIIRDELWDKFDRKNERFYSESSVAKKLFERHCIDWECYEEDEYVFLAVRKQGSESYSVFRISPYYMLMPNVDEIYFDD